MSEGTGTNTAPDGDFDLSSVWFTPREVAVARLASTLRTPTGIPYDDVAERGPGLVPVLDGPMTRKEAHEYRSRFRRKVILSGTTLLYAAYGQGLEPEELDETLAECVERARALLEAEAEAMPNEITIRHDHTTCPNCGGELA